MKKSSNTVNDPVIVAIDLGSSGVRAIAAQILPGDTFTILGIEKNCKYPCVQRGVVKDTEKAAYMIGETLRLLSNRIRRDPFKSFFLLVGGQKLQMVQVSRKIDLIHPQVVTEKMFASMKRECSEHIEKQNPSVAVLGIIPSYYVIDGTEQESAPTSSQRVTVLEVHYAVFIDERTTRDNLDNSVLRSNKVLEDSIIRADALLSVFGGEDSRILQDGCAVLDFGEQTTTLSVYKGSEYLATQVVPLGGQDITSSLCLLGMLSPVAEQVKCQYGCAKVSLIEKDYNLSVPSASKPTENTKIRLSQVASTIEHKLDDMLQPLLHTLNQYEQRLSHVYITGGGAQLNGIVEYLSDKTSIPVDYGSHAYLMDEKSPDEYFLPEYSSLVGAIINGIEYRKEHPVVSKTKGKIQKFKEQFFGMFVNQDNGMEG